MMKPLLQNRCLVLVQCLAMTLLFMMSVAWQAHAQPPSIHVFPAVIPHALITGGNYSVRVESNMAWSVIPSSVPDWITIRSQSSTRLSLDLSRNLSSASREAFIVLATVVGGEGSEATFHIVQEGPPVLQANGVNDVAQLTWQVFPEAVDRINIYEITTTPRQLLASVLITQHSFNHTGLASGSTHSYFVTAVGFDGVESAPSNTVTVTIPAAAGLADLTLGVHPNPAQNQLTLSGPVATSGYYGLAVVDMFGQPLLKQQVYLSSGEAASSVDVSGLNPGLYLFQVVAPTGKVIAKIKFEKE